MKNRIVKIISIVLLISLVGASLFALTACETPDVGEPNQMTAGIFSKIINTFKKIFQKLGGQKPAPTPTPTAPAKPITQTYTIKASGALVGENVQTFDIKKGVQYEFWFSSNGSGNYCVDVKLDGGSASAQLQNRMKEPAGGGENEFVKVKDVNLTTAWQSLKFKEESNKYKARIHRLAFTAKANGKISINYAKLKHVNKTISASAKTQTITLNKYNTYKLEFGVTSAGGRYTIQYRVEDGMTSGTIQHHSTTSTEWKNYRAINIEEKWKVEDVSVKVVSSGSVISSDGYRLVITPSRNVSLKLYYDMVGDVSSTDFVDCAALVWSATSTTGVGYEPSMVTSVVFASRELSNALGVAFASESVVSTFMRVVSLKLGKVKFVDTLDKQLRYEMSLALNKKDEGAMIDDCITTFTQFGLTLIGHAIDTAVMTAKIRNISNTLANAKKPMRIEFSIPNPNCTNPCVYDVSACAMRSAVITIDNQTIMYYPCYGPVLRSGRFTIVRNIKNA